MRIGTARYCGLDSFFSLSQRWHREVLKLFFTSLPWYVHLISTFTPPASLSREDVCRSIAGDVVQSMAGRVLGRLLRT